MKISVLSHSHINLIYIVIERNIFKNNLYLYIFYKSTYKSLGESLPFIGAMIGLFIFMYVSDNKGKYFYFLFE